MPFTIAPLNPASQIQSFGDNLDPVYRQLATFEYDPARAWKQVSSSPDVRGTVSGGPSYSRFLDFGSEQKFMPSVQRPSLTAAVQPDTKAFYQQKLGNVEWNSIDPFDTLMQIGQQSEQAFGKPSNPLDFLANNSLSQFLASKDVDPFGLGATGAPSRLADYALAFPLAIFAKLNGADTGSLLRGISGALPRGSTTGEDDPYYKLHGDPRYWQAIRAADPTQLDQLARTFASRFVDVGANSYVIEQLKAQFERDRSVVTGMSSGNEAIDYRAMKGLGGYDESGLHFAAPGLQQIPLVGTQLVQFLDPVSKRDKAAWDALTADQRVARLGQFGLVQMGSDLISSLPAFGALGTIIEVARTGGTVARVAAGTYDWVLRGAEAVAKVGLASALTNWSLEATWPGYSEFLGRQVDQSRPISGSLMAGLVNQTGYFATGSYGAIGLGKIAARVTGKTIGRVAGATVVRGVGHPTTPLYDLLGGSRMADMGVAAGLDPQGLKLSAQETTGSYIAHLVTERRRKIWESVTSGAPTGDPKFDAMPIEERIAQANDDLQASLSATHYQTAQVYEVLAKAREPESLVMSEAKKAQRSWFRGQARTINNAIAEMYIADYGPAWVTRQTGAYTEEAMRAHVKRTFDRLGADFTPYDGLHGEDSWAQVVRQVHAYEFSKKNGLMQAAMEERPGVPPTREAGKLSLVSSHHLFNDRAESVLAALKSEDPAIQRAAIDDLIDNTIEGEHWFARDWSPPHGQPRDRSLVKTSEVISWIEDIQPTLLVRRGAPKPDMDTADLPLNSFHSQLINEGVWDIAFKPVDDAGEFVSYVKTRSGKAFKTPWLDYPLANVDNIELGNRGIVMRKYDSLFRAFRTWRISEFQRGLLFRNLTGGAHNLDVTATQINQFHSGLYELAHRHAIQPQTIGAVGKGSIAGVGSAFHDELVALAERTFGKGPYLTKAGERIDVNWSKLVAESYRQSLRLNLTAGLTSHLKTRFGPIGEAAAWWSDIGYVNIRFNYSPVFKIGEREESLQLNSMAGVDPRGDPYIEALFLRNGIGEEHGTMTQEMTFDPALQGLRPTTPQERQARGYQFASLRAPETLADKVAKEGARIRVEQFREFVKGGNSIYASPRHALEAELAGLVNDAGDILPGMEGRVDEISRILTGELRWDEVRAAHHVGAELPGPDWTTDPLELGGRGAPSWIDETLAPGDRGLWHATTNVDGVMADGLMSRRELVDLGDESVGLGALVPDRYVSLTTSYDHAALIQTRMRLAVEAARGTATGREILDHFGPAYDEAFGLDQGANRLNWAIMSTESRKGGFTPPAHAPNEYSPEWLTLVIDGAFDDWGRYQVVKHLDYELLIAGLRLDNPEVWGVGMAAQWEDIKRINPDNIGVMQVGFKKGSTWKEGPDTNEVQMASDTIWALDRRILDAPLATDREGLLKQLRQTIRDDGETVIPGFGEYHDEIVKELAALDEATIPPSADNLSAVQGTPEFLTRSIEEQAPEMFRPGPWDKPGNAEKIYDAIMNPIEMKQHQALLMRIEFDRRQFPQLVRANGYSGLEAVFNQLGVPERNWLPFLMEDRELATAFANSATPEEAAGAFADLIAHSGREPRGQFDALYASEEWAALTSLVAIADRTAADDAFRLHFFNPYRGAVERSLNHPVLGIYPLSWAYKTARNWMSFLYDNHTIHGLRLGMAPAVAINHIVRAQNSTFAQSNEKTLEEYLGLRGPFGSAFLIFNLILPGDWSSIPFIASRTIRDLLRGTFDAKSMPEQLTNLGAPRDVRLLMETGGEIKDFVWGPGANPKKDPVPWEPFFDPNALVRGR